MRKLTSSLFFPALFLSTTTLVACSFSMQAGSNPNGPNAPQGSQSGAQPAQTQPAVAPAAPPQTGTPLKSLGRRPTPTPSSSQTTPPVTPPAPSTTPTTPPTTPPATGGLVTGATIFGGNTASTVDSGFKGNIYFVNAGATTLPDISNATPNGVLFLSSLNVTPQAFTTGFPGVDANRKENFVIRYEGPLVVATPADYDFRLVADDAAKLWIDGTEIVNNDGVKTAPADKTGPVHLVVGTHALRVDYLQTTGNVALQVFCKKAGGTEQICPNKLP